MNRVLIIDACQRSALAVTRSLGRRGIPVITADETPSALAGSSKFSQLYATYPSPTTNPKEFVATIRALCNLHKIDIVIPITEMTIAILIANRKHLSDVQLPFASLEVIESLSDKCSLLELAQTLNIPVPNSIFVDNLYKEGLTARAPFPLVLKPAKSWLVIEGKWHHTTVKIADDEATLQAVLSGDPAFQAAPFLLQEYIPGCGAGIFAIYDHGRPLAFFAHTRVREKPPRGGVSVLSESIPVDPVLEQYARKLLNHVNWHGVAMVEFRITPDGTPFLMEINTRFWGSLQLAIDSGVDFPWILYQIACDNEIEHLQRYRTRQKLRWLLGDLDSLYLLLRDPDFSKTEKFHAVFDFMKPSPFRTRHEVNRLGDMGPFWWELKQYIRDLIK